MAGIGISKNKIAYKGYEVIPIRCRVGHSRNNRSDAGGGNICRHYGGRYVCGALEVCKTATVNSTVLCMLPNTGERYLSIPLLSDIGVDMDEEELAIFNSTPNHRMALKAVN